MHILKLISTHTFQKLISGCDWIPLCLLICMPLDFWGIFCIDLWTFCLYFHCLKYLYFWRDWWNIIYFFIYTNYIEYKHFIIWHPKLICTSFERQSVHKLLEKVFKWRRRNSTLILHCCDGSIAGGMGKLPCRSLSVQPF